ncbi:MAG: rhomboid family intramembrane serine protease [Chlamydiota bacterium]|nr:rhomboid family intramembrane serine protease [Chlamydiota bacterium]
MTYTSQASLGPEFTPKIIKNLIMMTCIASIGSALLDIFITAVFNIPGPLSYLSLSWFGLNKLFLWQPLTYFFVYGVTGYGIGLSWLLGLAINMYILWVMGTNILERVGERPFLRFYLISGVLSGLVATFMMPITGSNVILTGAAPCILAILVSWVMLNPNSSLLLFFVLPIKSRWLVVGVISAIFLINLSTFDFIHLFFYMTGVATGYIYSVAAWNLRSPFPSTHEFDRTLAAYGDRIYSFFKSPGKGSGKIFDIKTGKSIDDENRFMDRMLEKISKYGKDSLTWREKLRMNRISKKRNKR